MIIREVRFDPDVHADNTIEPGDTQDADSSMWIAAKEHSNIGYRPVLKLVSR